MKVRDQLDDTTLVVQIMAASSAYAVLGLVTMSSSDAVTMAGMARLLAVPVPQPPEQRAAVVSWALSFLILRPAVVLHSDVPPPGLTGLASDVLRVYAGNGDQPDEPPAEAA
jgi:hypothetical protein